MAGIIGAKTNNNYGMAGVAGGWNGQGALFMHCIVGDTMGDTMIIHERAIAKAILHACQKNARVINMSLGGYGWYDERVDEAITKAYNEYGVTLVAAVGNSDSLVVAWPASHQLVIAVGGTMLDKDGDEKRWSAPDRGANYGPELEVSAPSIQIVAPIPDSSGIGYYGGTSSATAMVSGVVALIRSINPCIGPEEVREILQITADTVGGYNFNHDSINHPGHSLQLGYGRVNGYKAVKEAQERLGLFQQNITGTEEWNGNVRMREDIIIEDGGSLTLTSTCRLEMLYDTKIEVKKGGTLIIDGGTITAQCNSLWEGVLVRGDHNLSHVPLSNQGRVVITNGGTIENAICAVKILDDGGIDQFSLYGGGILQATKANFTNNRVAVEFNQYDHNNINNLIKCKFSTDAVLIDQSSPSYFVKMHDVAGIAIKGCQFSNTSCISLYGGGIKAYNSTLIVDGYCDSPITPCPTQSIEPTQFINLNYAIDIYGGKTQIDKQKIYNCKFINNQFGVHAKAGSTTRSISVKDCTFDRSYRGVYLSGYSISEVLSNKFTVSHLQHLGSLGLFMDACTGYHVEDNNFIGTDNNYCFGLYVYNSGTDPNEVYDNFFSNLNYGLIASGTNRSTDGEIGLCIKCNDFRDCNNDITIEGEISPTYGISKHQGSDNSVSTDQASNTFSDNTLHYADIYNEANGINYVYQDENTSTNRIEPLTNFVFGSVVSTNSENTEYNKPEVCPPKLDNGGGIEESKALLVESGQAINSLDQQLTTLVDGGDTPGLQLTVETTAPPQANTTTSELLTVSPYLSDEVMKATVENETAIPNAMVRDVLVANPHSAKSAEVMGELEQRVNPMPDYMMQQIMEGRHIVGQKEILSAQLADEKTNYEKAYKDAFLYYVTDTSNNNLDSLHALLTDVSLLKAKYQKAFLHFTDG